MGADLEKDISIAWLEFFLEDDDELAEIKRKYGKGEMLTGEVKKILSDTLCEFVKDFQDRRAKVTDEDVRKFMSVRPIDPNPKKWKEELDRRAAKKAEEEAAKKKAKEEAKLKSVGDEAARKAKKAADKEAKAKAAAEYKAK